MISFSTSKLDVLFYFNEVLKFGIIRLWFREGPACQFFFAAAQRVNGFALQVALRHAVQWGDNNNTDSTNNMV
jgi:hypothetical protein